MIIEWFSGEGGLPMSGGMAEQLRLLLVLQQRDSELQAIRRRIEDLTEGRELARQRQQVDGLGAQREAVRQGLARAKVDASRYEGMAEDHREEKSRLEARMYSGQIASVKEMSKMEAQISHLAEVADAAEEKALEAMAEAERLTGQLEELEGELAAAAALLARMEEENQRELAAAQEAEAGAAARREEAAAPIRQDLLARYERMLQRPGLQGRAVVPVQNGACSGCAVGLSLALLNRVKKMDDLYTCENCGRGLVWVDS